MTKILRSRIWAALSLLAFILAFAFAPPAHAARFPEVLEVWNSADEETFNSALGRLWRAGQSEQTELAGYIICAEGSRGYVSLLLTDMGDHDSVQMNFAPLGLTAHGSGQEVCGTFHTHPYRVFNTDAGALMQTLKGPSPQDLDTWLQSPGFDHMVIDKWGKWIIESSGGAMMCGWNATYRAMPTCDFSD